MRIQARAATLATVIAATQLVIAGAPASSAAEWIERPTNCRRSGNGPGAIVPPKAYPTTVPGRPYVPETAEFADTEKESASNFSATANWGDGTTSLAAVNGEESERGCYQVSAPSHTYLTPGTYSFSYAVHDAHTGLEHTIGSELFYVPSVLPTLIQGTAPRVIHATVRVPWSGVVAEFGTPAFGLRTPASGYAVSIEWGDGHSSPGTFSEPTFQKLAVSGAHTYSRPVDGAIKVSLSGGIETGMWTTANVLVPSQFKFLGQPILAAIPSLNEGSAYEIVFRLNRSLPQTKSGRIQASLSAHGLSSPIVSFGPRRTRACYAAGSDDFAGRTPKAGRRYRFALTIQGLTDTMTDGQATVHRYTSLVAMRSGASQRLGC
jgi:hypothetical protein